MVYFYLYLEINLNFPDHILSPYKIRIHSDKLNNDIKIFVTLKAHTKINTKDINIQFLILLNKSKNIIQCLTDVYYILYYYIVCFSFSF